MLNDFPSKIKEASAEYSPSVIANYCYEISKEYNRFYTEVSVLNEMDESSRNLRIALSSFVAKTIRIGMRLLGIIVPERM